MPALPHPEGMPEQGEKTAACPGTGRLLPTLSYEDTYNAGPKLSWFKKGQLKLQLFKRDPGLIGFRSSSLTLAISVQLGQRKGKITLTHKLKTETQSHECLLRVGGDKTNPLNF